MHVCALFKIWVCIYRYIADQWLNLLITMGSYNLVSVQSYEKQRKKITSYKAGHYTFISTNLHF